MATNRIFQLAKRFLAPAAGCILILLSGYGYYGLQLWLEEHFFFLDDLFGSELFALHVRPWIHTIYFIPIGFFLTVSHKLFQLHRCWKIQWPWLFFLALDILLLTFPAPILRLFPERIHLLLIPFWTMMRDFHGLLMGLCLAKGLFGKTP